MQARDDEAAGAAWQGVETRTGAVAPAIRVNRQARDKPSSSAIDGESIHGA
jgi:hypothetical protein